MLIYIKNKEGQLSNSEELSLYDESNLEAVLSLYKDDF